MTAHVSETVLVVVCLGGSALIYIGIAIWEATR